MHALARRVLRTIQRHALLGPADRVALAVSGGADSVAMARLFAELAAGGELRGAVIAGLVHVNHGLRGEESARDERFVRALGDEFGWPVDAGHVNVAALARERRRSIETTAREIRYEYFAAASARLGATRLATGHTLDDQAETVLLRLLRGAGARGVSGIRVRRGACIRPLLECRRPDIRHYLARVRQPYCEDSSNDDESIARNRIRHQLLPAVEHVSPSGIRALARFAALATDDEDFLAARAIEAASTVVLSNEAGAEVDVDLLNALPAALARRVVRRVAEAASAKPGLAARHVDAVRALAARDKVSGHLDLPGLTVRRRGPTISVTRSAGRSAADGAGALPFEYALAIGASTTVAEAGVRIETARGAAISGEDAGSGRGRQAAVRAESVTLPLSVRGRRPGDRLRPIGAPGRRKLQDLLVDRKVPRHVRDRLAIVVDADGRIVWVVGVTVAHECRITTAGESVVVLKAHQLEKGEE